MTIGTKPFGLLTTLSAAFLALSAPAAAECIPAELRGCFDGDTCRAVIAGAEEPVRLLGYDTPEIKGACPAEKALARQARDRLRQLIAEATDRQLCSDDGFRRDKYRRILARLLLDGRDVAAELIAEGLARPYDGGRREPWCP